MAANRPGQTGYVGDDPTDAAANALATAAAKGQSPGGLSPEEADLIRQLLGRFGEKQQAKTTERRRAGRIGRSATFGAGKAKEQDAFARAQSGKDLALANIRKKNEGKRQFSKTQEERVTARRKIAERQKEDRIRRLLGRDPGSAIGRSKITDADGKTTFRVAGVDQDLSSKEQADQQVAQLTNPENVPYMVDEQEERLNRIRRLLGREEVA